MNTWKIKDEAIVIDNSALLPLFLADEGDEFVQRVLKAAVEKGSPILAPTLCLLEFGMAFYGRYAAKG